MREMRFNKSLWQSDKRSLGDEVIQMDLKKEYKRI